MPRLVRRHPARRGARASTTARAGELRPFFAMEVLERALALEREGPPVAHLEVGEPDLPAPAKAVEACRQALVAGDTRYTDSRGLWELREAIAADAHRRSGVDVHPDRIVVTNGTSPAMLLVFGLLLDAGDEVILPEPHYPAYPNLVRFFGGVPVPVPTRPENAWQVDPEDVRRALTPRTRALVLSSPANPTGQIRAHRAGRWRSTPFADTDMGTSPSPELSAMRRRGTRVRSSEARASAP